ncbi:ferritin-like domain-containing protein [Deinococcus maricopensis]|uniref:Putative desiccation-associated protein n=1 Tax=Deinococcus maricopensis (strain DSM 21211 / LMG 22137 / NRRL B-23946 / LB-34) TaxID=709986 RepID=E8U933_DEIML|nr:ferritin-like domain-containing protein [Deinococcus maricopensis]ADV67572.1 putative desiccation-associated protein, precursor [Deinococcus maricopensis DSM 21211]
MSNSNISRRKALGTFGLVGAGAVLGACAPAMAVTPPKANLDATIFNFALNLEYLEAAFYLAAVGRLGELDAAGGSSAQVILPAGFNGKDGVGIASLSPEIRALANEIATDELAHVKAIRDKLGINAVAQPQIDLDASFKAAGKAASNGAITGFDPYANELFFLHGAFVFEDVGVTAYKGAARLLVDDKAGGNLENAAGILAVEAYHAGAIRTLLSQRRTQAAAAGLTVEQVVQAISNLRDNVDGPSDLDQGISPVGTGANAASNVVPTDVNGIAFSRTPRQVANIVLLDTTGKAATGGFFPKGLNGDFSAILAL